MDDCVEFVGAQENVVPWLDQSDIFVYPSVCHEAFGIAAVEAMARGCIVVTFHKGGLPEIIHHQENGYIVFNDNAEELSQVLQQIISAQDTVHDAMRQNAIQTSRQFTIQNVAKRLDEELKKLI